MQHTLQPAIVLFSYDLNQLPAEAQYFVIAALVMLMLSMLFMLMLYIRRWWMNARDKKKADLRFSYQYFIYDTLVGKRGKEPTPSVELLINRFRQEELNTSLKKQVMTDLLIELKRSFSGESAKQFTRLYTGLELQNFSITKLSKQDYISKIQGLREVSELNHGCPSLEWAIKKWQFSEDTLLADEARLAAVRAGSPQMLQFLDRLQEPAGEWLQIQLHHLLTIMPKAERPRLAEWLQSESPYALCLVLRLISLLQQKDATRQVIPLLHHPDNAVKREALHCLVIFDVKEANSTIFHLLDSEDESLQIAALAAIGQLGNHYHADLLRPLLRRDSSTLREAASQAISQIGQRDRHMPGATGIYKTIKSEI